MQENKSGRFVSEHSAYLVF